MSYFLYGYYTSYGCSDLTSYSSNIKKGMNSKSMSVVRSSLLGLPWCLSSKKSPANARDKGSIPGLRRSPGEGNGNPLQYSCLGNLMDRGAWPATVHGVTKSWTGLSDQTPTTIFLLSTGSTFSTAHW